MQAAAERQKRRVLSQKVPELVGELVGFLDGNPEMPGVVKGAMAHLNLVMIHPFADGNGRMARCLQDLVLARSGALEAPFSSIEEYLGHNARAYYDVLTEVGGGSWHPERDARPWIRFCLAAHYNQATTLLLRTQEMRRLSEALEEDVVRRKLPERSMLPLADAAIGLRVRNATYRTIAEVHANLASRDLKSLVAEGLLVASSERRRRFYIASEPLRAIRARTRHPQAPTPRALVRRSSGSAGH